MKNLKFWKLIHWGIILHLSIQVGYSAFMILCIFKPEGVTGPLYAAAKQMPFEFMVTRRLYAIEHWIAFGALAIYLGLTEFYPRMKKASS